MPPTYQLFHTRIKNPKTCTEFLLPNKKNKNKSWLDQKIPNPLCLNTFTKHADREEIQ